MRDKMLWVTLGLLTTLVVGEVHVLKQPVAQVPINTAYFAEAVAGAANAATAILDKPIPTVKSLAKPQVNQTKKATVHHTSKPAPTSTSTGGPYTCKDGTISHAKHRQGACSHHGGIA